MINAPSQRSVAVVMFSVSSRKATIASCVTATDAAETSCNVEATTSRSVTSGATTPWTRSTSPPVTMNAAVAHSKADGRRRECDGLRRHAGDRRGNDGVHHGEPRSGQPNEVVGERPPTMARRRGGRWERWEVRRVDERQRGDRGVRQRPDGPGRDDGDVGERADSLDGAAADDERRVAARTERPRRAEGTPKNAGDAEQRAVQTTCDGKV